MCTHNCTSVSLTSSIRNCLTVQWLGLFAFTAEGAGSVPGRGAKIHKLRSVGKKKKQNETNNNKNIKYPLALNVEKVEGVLRWYPLAPGKAQMKTIPRGGGSVDSTWPTTTPSETGGPES